MQGNMIHEVLRAVVRDPALVDLLRTSPDTLAKRLGLGPLDLRALRAADRLLPAKASEEIIFETGSTITGDTRYTLETGSTITGGTRYSFETGSTITGGIPDE